MKERESTDKEGLFVEAAAYVGSIAAGALALWAAVRDQSYRYLKKTTLLKDADAVREIGREAAAQFAKDGKGDFFTAYKPVRDAYSEAIEEGYKTLKVNNMYEKFDKLLTKTQKAGVIGIAITVISVGVGAVVNIAHRRNISRQLDKMDREKNPEQAQIR